MPAISRRVSHGWWYFGVLRRDVFLWSSSGGNALLMGVLSRSFRVASSARLGPALSSGPLSISRVCLASIICLLVFFATHHYFAYIVYCVVIADLLGVFAVVSFSVYAGRVVCFFGDLST